MAGASSTDNARSVIGPISIALGEASKASLTISLANVQDEPRPQPARLVLLGARDVTDVVVGSSALLGLWRRFIQVTSSLEWRQRLQSPHPENQSTSSPSRSEQYRSVRRAKHRLDTHRQAIRSPVHLGSKILSPSADCG